jgi:hypothetical protein
VCRKLLVPFANGHITDTDVSGNLCLRHPSA